MGLLFDAICLLTKLNLPFHGHDESDTSKNRGVFREFVEFLGHYDESFKDYLENSLSNCSHRIQNETIAILGDKVVADIVAAVKQAKFYADETTNRACQEQVSLVVRFVTPVGNGYYCY